jgi:serine/threonine protein kinase
MSAMYHIASDSEIEGIPTIYEDAFHFIKKCFLFDVDKRPTAFELLKDKFITKFNTVFQP